MTLKKINPEDLVVGKEYYVKLKFDFKDAGLTPLCFRDILEYDYWYHKDQPIYTIEQTADTDNDLEMLVNVASRLYAPHLEITIGNAEIITGKKPPSDPKENMNYWIEVNAKLATLTALDLITACKNALKEGER